MANGLYFVIWENLLIYTFESDNLTYLENVRKETAKCNRISRVSI